MTDIYYCVDLEKRRTVDINNPSNEYIEEIHLADLEFDLKGSGSVRYRHTWDYSINPRSFCNEEISITKDIYEAIKNSHPHVVDTFIRFRNIDYLTDDKFTKILPITRIWLNDDLPCNVKLTVLSKYGNLLDLVESGTDAIVRVRSTADTGTPLPPTLADKISQMDKLYEVVKMLLPTMNTGRLLAYPPPSSRPENKQDNESILAFFEREYTSSFAALDKNWMEYLSACDALSAAVNVYNKELNAKAFIDVTYAIRDIDVILFKWYYSVTSHFEYQRRQQFTAITIVEQTLYDLDLVRPRLLDVCTEQHKAKIEDDFAKTAWGKSPKLEETGIYLDAMVEKLSNINTKCQSIVDLIYAIK